MAGNSIIERLPAELVRDVTEMLDNCSLHALRQTSHTMQARTLKDFINRHLSKNRAKVRLTPRDLRGFLAIVSDPNKEEVIKRIVFEEQQHVGQIGSNGPTAMMSPNFYLEAVFQLLRQIAQRLTHARFIQISGNYSRDDVTAMPPQEADQALKAFAEVPMPGLLGLEIRGSGVTQDHLIAFLNAHISFPREVALSHTWLHNGNWENVFAHIRDYTHLEHVFLHGLHTAPVITLPVHHILRDTDDVERFSGAVSEEPYRPYGKYKLRRSTAYLYGRRNVKFGLNQILSLYGSELTDPNMLCADLSIFSPRPGTFWDGFLVRPDGSFGYQ